MSGPISKSLIVVILTLVADPALAQVSGGRSISLDIHGQVRFAVGGAPAQNVIVRLESFRGGIVAQMMTDRTGKFMFSGLKPDQYIVTVRAEGFKETQQSVDLQTTSSAYVLLQLMPDESASPSGPAPSGKVFDAKVPPEALKEFEKGQAALLQKKDMKRGLLHLEKAVSLYPNYLEAQLLLGTAYMDAQQWDKAERALSRALEINPKTPEALFALGEVYRQQERYPEAEKSLLDGLKLNDNSWQGHLALGKTYWAMGDVGRAAPHATRAHELNPNFPQVHLLMGNIFLRQRDPQHALSEFEDYLKQEPNGPFAPQTRALVEKIRKALASPKSPYENP
jgi:Tfp pilus assembly protein PilF